MRCFKEQFINVVNGDVMTSETIKELVVTKSTGDITGDMILTWVMTVEAQRPQTTILANLKENEEFDATRRGMRDKLKHNKTKTRKNTKNIKKNNNKYCRSAHQLHQCPVYSWA